MVRTVARRQPQVYSASVSSDTRGIYVAPTGFPADIERDSGGDLGKSGGLPFPKTRRRRPGYCGDTCRLLFTFSDGPRNRDSRGPSAQRR